MKTENLIVASIEEANIGYTCAILMRFLRTGESKTDYSYPELRLVQPGQIQGADIERIFEGDTLKTVYFLGDFLPESTEEKEISGSLKKILGKRRGLSVVCLNESEGHTRSYLSEISGLGVKWQDYEYGVVQFLLDYCKERREDFCGDDISEKQKDKYIQYCLENALNDFRQHQESKNFVALVKQLADNTKEQQNPVDSLSGEELSKLLQNKAEYATYCKSEDWKKLTLEQWVDLVIVQPQFMNRAEFQELKSKLKSPQWCKLLSTHTHLASPDAMIPWDKFTLKHWLTLLNKDSCFIERFRENVKISELTIPQWVTLLCAQPVFLGECPVKDKITGPQWKQIALSTTTDGILPSIPKKVLQSLKGDELVSFLKFHPRVAANYLTSKQLDGLTPPIVWAWWTFIVNHCEPQGKTAKDLRRLDGHAWAFLISHNSKYCSACTECNGWKRFTAQDWCKLLSYAPAMKKYCDKYDGWELFQGEDWCNLLLLQPHFAEKCDGKNLSKDRIFPLLTVHPELSEKIKNCPPLTLSDELSLAEIHRGVFAEPSWVSKKEIPWETLKPTALARLLVLDPKLEDEFVNRNLFLNFSSSDWYIILRNNPKYAKYCNFRVFSPNMRLACLSLKGVSENAVDPIPWPTSNEMDMNKNIRIIKENAKVIKTIRDGKVSTQLIDWGRLTALKSEYASCCPQSQWSELSVSGWQQLEKNVLSREHSEQLDPVQREQLWGYYSAFLRLPQERHDAYAGENETVYNEIRRNAVTTYRDMLVGNGLKSLREELRLVAKSRYPVLILGESGTGKENAARMLHTYSGRGGGFKAFNCAASSSNLIESTLFGHTKGAFTGAVGKTAGVIETANNGTLFFDEIAEFPLETQAKLLRVMQWRRSRSGKKDETEMVYAYCPVGGEDEGEKEVSVRIVAATNKNLKEMIEGKSSDGARFRQDLYYRLNTIVISTVPLREHKEDIPEIANLYWRVDLGMPEPLKSEEIEFLQSLDYPANVRQLQQLLTQYSIYFGSRTLQGIHAILSNMEPRPENATANLLDPQPTAEVPTPQKSTADTSENKISIVDEKGKYKTANAIATEYAKMIYERAKSQKEAANILGVAVNTLRKRRK